MSVESGLVSIIIPAYNAEKWLERAVRSCMEQTYREIEILVINDGSTDNTQTIVENLQKQDARIRLISQENGGVSKARNAGLDNAKGEYVTFLDADDELVFDGVEILLSTLIENGADICAGQTQRFTEKGIGEKVECTGKIQIFSGKEALLRSIEDYPETYAIWAKIYKKNILERIRFPEGKRVHEDSFFLFLCLVNMIKFAVVDTIVHKYHVVGNSASRSAFSEKMFDILTLAEEKERIIQEKFPEFSDKAVNLRIKANMALLFNLCKDKSGRFKRQEKECLRYVRKNKKHFKPATSANKKWFFIITHRLYGLFKFYQNLRG